MRIATFSVQEGTEPTSPNSQITVFTSYYMMGWESDTTTFFSIT